MRTIILCALFVFALSIEYQKDGNVTILNDDIFEDAIKEFPYLVVLFYAPWCEQSKKAKELFSLEAGDAEPFGFKFAQLDATVYKKSTKKYKIMKYYTIKLFYKGQVEEYEDDYLNSNLREFLRKAEGIRKLKSTIDIKAMIKDYQSVFIYYGNDEEKIEEFTIMYADNPSIPIAICSNVSLFKEYNVTEGKMMFYSSFDNKQMEYTGKIDPDVIQEFFFTNGIPNLFYFDKNAAYLLFYKKQPAIVYYRLGEKEDDTKRDELFIKLAEKLKGKIRVMISGIANEFEMQITGDGRVDLQDLPAVHIFDTRESFKSYRMPGEITEENIMKFIDDWTNDKLVMELNSEEIPTNQTGVSYKIVGKTFEDIVIKSDKDVLVKFYAEWCSRSKQFSPYYTELVLKYKHNENILFGELETTHNEVPNITIAETPTLLFWPAGKKDSPPLKINGTSVRDIELFISTHATYPFQLIPSLRESWEIEQADNELRKAASKKYGKEEKVVIEPPTPPTATQKSDL